VTFGPPMANGMALGWALVLFHDRGKRREKFITYRELGSWDLGFLIAFGWSAISAFVLVNDSAVSIVAR